MSFKSRLFKIILGLIVFITTIISLLPTLISHHPFQAKAIAYLNSFLDGNLSIKHIEAGWLSGLRIDGLELKDIRDRTVLKFDTLQLSHPLLTLLAQPCHFESLEITSPWICLIEDVHEEGYSLQKIFKSRNYEHHESDDISCRVKTSSDNSKTNVSTPSSFHGTIKITNGLIRIVKETSGVFEIREIYHKIVLNLDQETDFSFSALFGKKDRQAGKVTLKGSICQPNTLSSVIAKKISMIREDAETLFSPALFKFDCQIEKLPLFLLDELFAVDSPDYKLYFKEALGSEIDINAHINLSSTNSFIQAIARSNNLNANIDVRLEEQSLQIHQMELNWNIQPSFIKTINSFVTQSFSNEYTLASQSTLTLTADPIKLPLPLKTETLKRGVGLIKGTLSPLVINHPQWTTPLEITFDTALAQINEHVLTSKVCCVLELGEQTTSCDIVFQSDIPNLDHHELKFEAKGNLPQVLGELIDQRVVVTEACGDKADAVLKVQASRWFAQDTPFDAYFELKSERLDVGPCKFRITPGFQEIQLLKPFSTLCFIRPSLLRTLDISNEEAHLEIPVQLELNIQQLNFNRQSKNLWNGFSSNIELTSSPIALKTPQIGKLLLNKLNVVLTKVMQSPCQVSLHAEQLNSDLHSDIATAFGNSIDCQFNADIISNSPSYLVKIFDLSLLSPFIKVEIPDIELKPDQTIAAYITKPVSINCTYPKKESNFLFRSLNIALPSQEIKCKLDISFTQTIYFHNIGKSLKCHAYFSIPQLILNNTQHLALSKIAIPLTLDFEEQRGNIKVYVEMINELDNQAKGKIVGNLLFNHSDDEHKIEFNCQATEINKEKRPFIDCKGTIANLWDQGTVSFKRALINLNAQINELPLSLFSELFLPHHTINKYTSLFGSNVSIFSTVCIESMNGSAVGSIASPTLKSQFDFLIENGLLKLKSPLKAEVLMTKKGSRALFADLNPLFLHALRSEHPIKCSIDPSEFEASLIHLGFDSLSINNAKIELGKIYLRNKGILGLILGLLQSKPLASSKEIPVLFTPLYIRFNQGIVTCERVDFLVADDLPMASWGMVDLKNDTINMVVGLTERALSNGLKLNNLPSGYILQIPIRGTTSHPKVDKAKAIAKITGLSLRSKGKKGTASLVGSLLQAATETLDQEAIPPEPTTSPLPWDIK